MKLSVYLQGLRATHYVCLVRNNKGSVCAVLSVPKLDASYGESKRVFKERVRQMRDKADPERFYLSYYR